MLQSYEDFKTAVTASLLDKISQRIEAEKEDISNKLFRGIALEAEKTEEHPQSNADEN